jgi:hypothetical protein
MPSSTRSPVCRKRPSRTRVDSEAPETSGIPHAMGLRFIACSPRRDSSVATVAFGLTALSDPVEPNSASEDLTPALGARTTRFPRTLQRRRLSCQDFAHAWHNAPRPATHRTPDAAASTASHPACLTIAIRPSSGIRQRGCRLIRTKRQQKYFLIWYLTAPKHHGSGAGQRNPYPEPAGANAAGNLCRVAGRRALAISPPSPPGLPRVVRLTPSWRAVWRAHTPGYTRRD